MYIYDRQLPVLGSPRDEQAVILQPSQVYDYSHKPACVREWYGFGQGVPSSVSYNQPGQPLSPQSDYILAPELMYAVDTLLSIPVPAQHLLTLGPNVNPLMVERVLTIFRYDDGRLQVGPVKFGTVPQKEIRTGSITSSGPIRYPATPDFALAINVGSQARPWLFIHTHPTVNPIPEIPSGIREVNNSLSGDLHILHNESKHQIGIMTIGINDVITNFLNSPQAIPFTLAIRDPIKGLTDYRPTRTLDSHNAASTALRLMFKGKTVSGYYTGDLRTGRAIPYLSVRQQRKMTAKTGD